MIKIDHYDLAIPCSCPLFTTLPLPTKIELFHHLKVIFRNIHLCSYYVSFYSVNDFFFYHHLGDMLFGISPKIFYAAFFILFSVSIMFILINYFTYLFQMIQKLFLCRMLRLFQDRAVCITFFFCKFISQNHHSSHTVSFLN